MVTDKDVAEELHEVESKIKHATECGISLDEKMALYNRLYSRGYCIEDILDVLNDRE